MDQAASNLLIVGNNLITRYIPGTERLQTRDYYLSPACIFITCARKEVSGAFASYPFRIFREFTYPRRRVESSSSIRSRILMGFRIHAENVELKQKFSLLSQSRVFFYDRAS